MHVNITALGNRTSLGPFGTGLCGVASGMVWESGEILSLVTAKEEEKEKKQTITKTRSNQR